MSICRVYYRSDGTVAILYPNIKHKLPTESDAEFIERIASAAPISKQDLDFDNVDTSLLPQDRSTREQWRRHPSGNGVIVDGSIERIKDKRQRLRAEALEKLKPLGITSEHLDALV